VGPYDGAVNAPSTALLVTAHGSPDSLDELPGFLANIRRGRPAPPPVVAEVRRRYEAIGGHSPLTAITHAQAEALGTRLGLPARVAMRLWRPYPGEVLAELATAGVERVISVPLAPYSVDVYHDAVAEAVAAQGRGLSLVRIAPWNTAPALVRAFAEEIERALDAVQTHGPVALVFTAHSLPQRVVEAGDPYATLVEATAQAVGAVLSRPVPQRLAYQSQGMSAEAWLGPDLPSTLEALRAEGFAHVVVAPIGFVSDHVEILYDLDQEAQAQARALGLGLSRPRTLNVAPGLIDALEAAVRAVL
jgi:ferrochelatase